MVFEARLDDGRSLKQIVGTLKELVRHVQWEVNSDGIQLQSMDSGHIALVSCNLVSDQFNHYRCDTPGPIGLDMIHLGKIFATFQSGSVALQCELDGDDIDRQVKVTFQPRSLTTDEKRKITDYSSDDSTVDLTAPSKKNRARLPLKKRQDYFLRMLDIDEEPLGIPEMQYRVQMSMPCSELVHIVNSLEKFGPNVRIRAEKNCAVFSSVGQLGKAKIKLVHEKNINGNLINDSVFQITVDEPYCGEFPLNYLRKFSTASPLCSRVVLSLNNDVPMCVAYDVPDLGHLKFYLAAKLDDSDDEAGRDASDVESEVATTKEHPKQVKAERKEPTEVADASENGEPMEEVGPTTEAGSTSPEELELPDKDPVLLILSDASDDEMIRE